MPFLSNLLLKIRPSYLAEFLKKVLSIQRKIYLTLDGHLFDVDPVSQFGHEIINQKIYEPALSDILRVVLRPGDTFIDVGANEGYFTVLGSGLVEDGTVFSIEPQSRLIPVIQKNLSLNDCRNVSVRQVAFSSKNERVQIHLANSTNSGATSLYKHWRSKAATEEVEAIALDQFVDNAKLKRIRFMKIDCEGAEFVVLAGARKVLSQQHVDFISVDFHPHIVGESIVRQLDSTLRQFGYVLTRVSTGPWIYHLPLLQDVLSPLAPLQSVAPLTA